MAFCCVLFIYIYIFVIFLLPPLVSNSRFQGYVVCGFRSLVANVCVLAPREFGICDYWEWEECVALRIIVYFIFWDEIEWSVEEVFIFFCEEVVTS